MSPSPRAPVLPPLVLVIAASEIERSKYVDTLSTVGFEAIAVESADAAIALVATRKPAAILLDLGLPRADEWATLGRLKLVEGIPVVAIAALGKAGSLAEDTELRVDHVLIKPCLAMEIALAMRQVLATERARNE